MTTDKHEDLSTQHWPVEIRLKQAEKALEVDFDDGAKFRYPGGAAAGRESVSEVMGHGPGQKTIVAGGRHVGILALEPVGNYAVRIKFDDLHDTGLYSWRYLYELGRDQERSGRSI
jgi:DUF971 family protein